MTLGYGLFTRADRRDFVDEKRKKRVESDVGRRARRDVGHLRLGLLKHIG